MSSDVFNSTKTPNNDANAEVNAKEDLNTPPPPPEDWKPPGVYFHSYSKEFLFPETNGEVDWDLYTPPPPPDGWQANFTTEEFNWAPFTPPPPTTAEPLVSQQCLITLFSVYISIHMILCSLGIVGNCLSIAVIHHNSRKNVTNLILQMLGIFDSVYLLVAIIHTFTFQGNKVHQTVTSEVLYTTTRVTQLASIGQIVIVGFYRYIAICWPFKAIKICTYTNAYIAMTINIIVAIGVNIPLYMFNADHTILPGTLEFQRLYWGLFYEIGLYFALPLSLLMVFKIGLVRELWKSARVDSSHNTNTRREASEVTAVVITIVLVFIISYTPGTVNFIDRYFFYESFYPSQSCLSHSLKFFIFSFCPKINSAVNFFIYFFIRRSFREGLKALLLCKKISGTSRRRSETLQTAL